MWNEIEKQMSLPRLADQLGVSRKTTWHWKAKAGIPAKHWPKVSAITGVPVNDIQKDFFQKSMAG